MYCKYIDFCMKYNSSMRAFLSETHNHICFLFRYLYNVWQLQCLHSKNQIPHSTDISGNGKRQSSPDHWVSSHTIQPKNTWKYIPKAPTSTSVVPSVTTAFISQTNFLLYQSLTTIPFHLISQTHPSTHTSHSILYSTKSVLGIYSSKSFPNDTPYPFESPHYNPLCT